MIDLNDLRIFERVAAFRSFSAAARALGAPKSTVSRSIARLEENLGIRLFERTTRDVLLTPSGEGLLLRCSEIMSRVGEAIGYAESFGAAPSGLLRISAGIGFGINVLSEEIPEFLSRHPAVSIALDLSDRERDLVSDGIDVAIRMGSMRDSNLIATQLGCMHRYLCAAPAYLERRATPKVVDDIRDHDVIEMLAGNGRPRSWTFSKGDQLATVELEPRASVNDPLTIHRLALNGLGLAIISGYLCAPEIAAGRLVRLLPEWEPPAVNVSIVFPSNRELSPAVRAFVEHMKLATLSGPLWLNDPLTAAT